MPSRSSTPSKQGTGARVVVAVLGAFLVVGSLMTLWLNPAAAGTSAPTAGRTEIFTALGPSLAVRSMARATRAIRATRATRAARPPVGSTRSLGFCRR